jgi:hypothetical protein
MNFNKIAKRMPGKRAENDSDGSSDLELGN